MNATAAFEKLLEPIQIGGMTIKNRIAMAPMGTAFATPDGVFTEQGIAYYEARAKGGAGLIIVENVGVDFHRCIHAPNRPAIDNDLPLPGLMKLAKTIQKHGAKAVIQLNQSGRMGKSKLTGFQPVAPSPIPIGSGSTPAGELPRELAMEEIHEIVNLFAEGAARAKKAGFDGLEVHAAHAYLLAEFLSPFTNKRQDAYGGSLENRARFLIEVLEAIRKSVGHDYPVGCRLNAREYGVEDGLTLEDTRTIAAMIEGLVDFLHITAWGYGQSSLVNFPESPGGLLPLAAAIKREVAVPVIGVGRMTLDVSEQAIREGMVDIVAIGRGLLADSDLPNHFLAGRPELVRPCIACFHCLDAGYLKETSVSCAVNGAVGQEREYEIKPARKSKTIAVIGAGPAGMEAARVLALRGHKVILLEKENRIGGQVRLAMVPPHKRERIEPLLDYFVTQLDRLKVEIQLNTEANIELLGTLRPDAVILATGSRPVIPQLPGVERGNVVTAIDILAGRAEAGQKVLIIGGGSVGCETAEFLCARGKEVTVAEMLPDLASDMGFRDRGRLLTRINTLPIKFITRATCEGISPGEAVIKTPDGQKQSIGADSFILAAGAKQNNTLYPLLKAKGFETHLAGDCWRLGRIAGAISDGLRLGCIL
jgi:2,4-dienoyl-CoA reductase-like NADH-dependent reductase (Old Yellow Enzyme family)/NADPH-dependent 2,4-dienoyl-CoA reductase/sulfur reductase-like enzyme